MGVLDAYPWIRTSFEGVKEDQGGMYVTAECSLQCHKVATLRFWIGENGCLFFKCWSGQCAKLEILRSVGAGWKDCFPDGKMPDRPKQEIVARYHYHDEMGRILYTTVRLEPGTRGRDKDFRQTRPKDEGEGWEWSLGDVRRVLYRLPELIAAKPSQPVFVVAGEKDVETLRQLGLVATTNVCGEQAEWLDSYSETLAGRDVVVIDDADGPGRRHGDAVCGSLLRHARTLRRVQLAEKDATAFTTACRWAGITAPADIRSQLEGAVKMARLWIVGSAA